MRAKQKTKKRPVRLVRSRARLGRSQAKKVKRLKKVVAKSRPKITKRKIASKSSVKKVLPNKASLEITAAVLDIPKFSEREMEPSQNFIKKQNARLSPYVLDLKNIKTAEESARQQDDKETKIITAEIFNSFNKKTFSFNTHLQKFYQNFKNNLAELKPSAKIKITNTSKLKILKKRNKIKLPEINWPTFDWRLPKLQTQEVKLGRLTIPLYWKKAFFGFIIFCLIFILPFNLYGYYQNLQGKKNDVLQKTGQALVHLTLSQKAISAQDLYYTQVELQAASQNFSQAKNELNNINFVVQGIIKLFPQLNEQFTTAQKLIEIGEKLSRSAAALAATLDQINFDSPAQAINLTDKIIALKDCLNLISPDLKSANENLEQLDLGQIPADFQNKIITLQQTLPLLEKNVDNFISSADLFAQLLGQDSKKRYLMLFQNNHEIRPTGGFIGSFALADFNQGNLEKINIPGGGPYDLKAGLTANIKSPTPLNIMNPRWEFQDANWFADLPSSAEKLNWFYEKSGGPTVDGLIFINATFLEKILKITGPIELPEYNKTINADNFFLEIQENVELEEPLIPNKPKQIIADLAPKIIDRLLHSDRQKFTELLDMLLTSLSEKEVQLYFSNYSLEKLVLNSNWGGQLKNTDRDFLEIVSTNIAGEKTDAKIKQSANLEVNVGNDGSIINTLTLTRNHTGLAGEAFYGVPNLDYLRIYVPKDSELLSAAGFSTLPEELFTIPDTANYDIDPDLAYSDFSRELEPISQTAIYHENNKTVFANWLRVEPGQSQIITLQYKLPFKLNLQPADYGADVVALILKKLNLNNENTNADTEKYSLLWQKQSGRENFDISVKINFQPNLNYQLVYPDSLSQNKNSFTYADQLTTDKILAIIFQAY